MRVKYTYLVAYEIKYADGSLANGDIEISARYKLNSYEKLKETRKIITEICQKEVGKSVDAVSIQNIILLKKRISKEKL